MADYISREALKEVFENADADVCESYPDGHCDWGFGRKNINDVIDGVPTADVEPVRHGRWILRKEHIYLADGVCKEWYNFFCSECDAPAPSGSPTCFCPNCGAKMALEVDNDN